MATSPTTESRVGLHTRRELTAVLTRNGRQIDLGLLDNSDWNPIQKRLNNWRLRLLLSEQHGERNERLITLATRLWRRLHRKV